MIFAYYVIINLSIKGVDAYEKDLFPEGFVNKEAARLLGKAEAEYEEYLERREPWDC